MPNEERDVPPLDNLLADLGPMQERLDAAAKAGTLDAGQFLQNELMPFLKDLVESTLFGFEDIQDLVNPIEVPGEDAAMMIEIFQATKESNPGNTLLAEKIDRAIAVLSQDGGEDDEDEDEEEA
jgi:polygalacturonase